MKTTLNTLISLALVVTFAPVYAICRLLGTASDMRRAYETDLAIAGRLALLVVFLPIYLGAILIPGAYEARRAYEHDVRILCS